MNFPELRTYLADHAAGKAAPLASCYALSGDDAWLLRESVRAFKGLLDPDWADINFAEIPLSGGADAVVAALNTCPVFDSLRVVVVPDWTPAAADNAALKAYFDSPNPSSVLVVTGMGEKAKLPPRAVTVDCNRLPASELTRLVGELLSAPPERKMEREALAELLSRTMRYMARIVSEVHKLKAYSDGVITLADVRLLVTEETELQLWTLSDAVGSGDRPRALEVLDRLIKKSEDPLDMVNMLYKHYRRLLHISLHKGDSDADLAPALGVKAYAVTMGRKAAARYTPVRLKKCVDTLHSVQYDMLTGRIGKDSALHTAVLTLLTI